MATRHVLAALDIGGTTIDQIVEQEVNTNVQRTARGTDGFVDPRMLSMDQQSPALRFRTLGIAKVLANVGIDGFSIPGGANPALAYWKQVAEFGTRVADASLAHEEMSIEAGLVYWTTIEARQDDVASCEVMVQTKYDGTNEPIVFAGSQGIGVTAAPDELFKVGPVVVNGAELEGIVGARIESGIRLMIEREKGDIWPRFIAIQEREPRIVLTSRFAEAMRVYGLDGTQQGVTDSKVYLRKASAAGAGNVADATAEHVLFSIDEGFIGADRGTATHPAPAENEIVIQPLHDGTNPVLAVSSAVAITVP